MSDADKPPAADQGKPAPPGRGQPVRTATPGVVDVLSALHRQDGNLAAQEQKVANYVKEHLEAISSMTIGDLAAGCGVSKPTVIRFCRSLGCTGFPDFKLRLAQNLAVSAQYLHDSATGGAVPSDRVIDHVIDALVAGVDRLRREVDVEMLDAARDAILTTRQIVFAGIGGGSSMVAQEAANRFFRLDFPAINISDSYVLQMRAATLGPGDLLVAISASGEANAIVGACEIAGGYGATTACITKPDTRLAAAAGIPILVDLPEDPDIFKPTASRYAHMVVVDSLAMAVAQAQADKTREYLRRIRASLTAYHGRTGPQPLGD
ncbi:MurR/RpiR family transcriptional regulator [Oceanibium sediminis]|uniref:MurR/RpiR family transcriptional regulator n=1 Tax=Oceanibium sediminis TaxID=2026339 RepID=UPI000DD3BF33|nr:MurR/RpiR family transcriptional regulator [Oceanibium sediminis]